MEEKKSFFAALEPKSALAVGIVGGVLFLGTIGFIIMLILSLVGNSTKAKTTETATKNTPSTEQNTTPVVTKSDRPKVELFVMSYCPYGLQMEKAFLPAMELLKNKADMDIKFVSYAMHGEKELAENTRQYCIQKDFNDKYISYLKCFTNKDDYKSCLSTVGLTEAQISSCVAATDKQFKTMELFKDRSTWLSGSYPQYPVHATLNDQYGVQGSPTLIINGAEVSANRTPEAVKQAICAAFNNAPSECSQTLSTAAPSASFGGGTGSASASADCGN